MMIQNGMMKSNPEPVKPETKPVEEHDHKEEKQKDELAMLSLLTGMSLIPMDTVSEIKELHHCYHELDKRISVIEKIVDYNMRKGF